MALPFIASLALGSGGVGGSGVLGTVGGVLGNVPIIGSTLSSIVSNPIGAISSIGSAIGGLFSSNAGAVQLADKRTGNQDMQGVMLFLHDINQQNGGVWLAGEDCPWVGSGWNDNVTAIYIAPGFEFDFYDDINFGGKSFTISANDPIRKPNEPFYQNGAGQWWNDKLSSFRIRKVDKNALSFPQIEAQQLKQNNVSKTPILSDPPPRPYDTTTGASYQDVFGNGLVSTQPTTTTTTTEPEKKGSMLWLILLVFGGFLFKDKIAKFLK